MQRDVELLDRGYEGLIGNSQTDTPVCIYLIFNTNEDEALRPLEQYFW